MTFGGALCGGEGRGEGAILGDCRPAVAVIQAQGPDAGRAPLEARVQAGAAAGLCLEAAWVRAGRNELQVFALSS